MKSDSDNAMRAPFGYLIEKAGINNGYYFVSLSEYEHVEERFRHIYKPIYDAPPSAAKTDRDGWMPIESAPKDGKFLALMHDGREPPNLFCEIIEWNSHGRGNGRWMNTIGSEYAEDAEAKGWSRPLLWHPLPSAPVKQEGKMG